MPGSAPRIYECRVQAVRSQDRVLDAISVRGRVFKDLSYLLPYISAMGSGLDCVPNVGDTCLVLATDNGLQVAIGFRVSLADGGEGKELGARVNPLPEGSMALRAVGEDGSDARVICYRGGTAVIGSGALAVSVYTPMGFIQHLFDNWTQEGPGGHVKWTREPGTASVQYHAEYRVGVDAKEPGFRVNVDIANGDVPVRVKVTRQPDDPRPALDVSVDRDGVAHVSANILDVRALARIELTAPNLIINGRRVRPVQEPI